MADYPEPMDCQNSGTPDPPAVQIIQFGHNNAGSQQPDQPYGNYQVSAAGFITQNTLQGPASSIQDPVSLQLSNVNMDEVDPSDPPAGNLSNIAAGGNTDANSVQKSVIRTQPQPTGGSVSQTWTPGNTTDQQARPQLQHYRNEEELNKSMHSQNPDVPTQDVAGATNTIGMQPSAPQDTAKFNIIVEWSAPFPDRWRAVLQKALQSWFNSSLPKDKKEKYNIVKLQLMSDQNHAEVEVEPSTALDIVKKVKTAPLTFKELNQSTMVHFLEDTKPVTVPLNRELPVVKEKELMQQVDMFVNAAIDLDKLSLGVQTELLKRMGKYQTGNKLSFSGSLVEVERFYREVCKLVGGPEAGMNTGTVRNDPSVEIPQNTGTSGAPPAFITPLHQYWYFSHAYKKEIDQIQDKFGVKINAEVAVSVTAEDQTRPDSVGEASDKLTDLYQTSTTTLQSLPIRQTQLDSQIVKDVVRNIQSDQAKMAIIMSVDGCILSGPKNTISGVQSRLNSESGQELGTSVGSSSVGKMEIDSRYTPGSSTLEMDIKDTLDPIMMSDALWKLMNKTSCKQFAEIENKYGIQIFNQPVQDSTKIKVMIKSKDNQFVNLESHAHRAFIHLYQKISMSAITCPLSSPLDERNLKNELEGHRLVCDLDEKIKIWKLVGLPRNLAPAIADIEKLAGKSVFDDKTKKLIDYSENSQKFCSHNWKHLEEASSSVMGPGSSVDPQTSTMNENEKSKDDDCPICMDKFTDQVKLKCGHGFCRECLNLSVKNMGEICPVCKKIYGKVKGNQPKGTMTFRTRRNDLPGYYGCGTIEILYDIPAGKQTYEHPNPGTNFSGTQRQAFLPNNAEGNEVLQLLQRAFDQRLIFTVGMSNTSGVQNTVTWNDIHHKTSMSGGPQNYGYPDPHYLKRVKEELKAKGIE